MTSESQQPNLTPEDPGNRYQYHLVVVAFSLKSLKEVAQGGTMQLTQHNTLNTTHNTSVSSTYYISRLFLSVSFQ